jgi:hypothetical protein
LGGVLRTTKHRSEGDADAQQGLDLNTVMPKSAQLWWELLEAILWNRGIRRSIDPLAKFNELVKERIPEIPQISPKSCEIVEEPLRRSGLHKLDRRHMKDQAFQTGGKIILFRHGGKDYIIDGHHRVTRWLAESDQGDLVAIVVRLKGG